MKKTIFLLMLLVLFSCTKEPVPVQHSVEKFLSTEQLYDLFQEQGIQISYEEIEAALQSKIKNQQCWNTGHLNDFLTEFSETEIDLIITVPNDYFQDANCNVAKWTVQLKERRASDSIAVNTLVQPIDFTWIVSGDSISTQQSPILRFRTYSYFCDTVLSSEFIAEINENENKRLIEVTDENVCWAEPNNCNGIFEPSCDGCHDVSLIVTLSNGAQYTGQGRFYGQVNWAEYFYPPCDTLSCVLQSLGSFDFDCFCPLKFDEYQFLTKRSLQWDLDSNYTVNVGDLTIFLSNYGPCASQSQSGLVK